MTLGAIYDTIYRHIAGSHPHYMPWHFQWLFMRRAHAWQAEHFAELSGFVIDAGCGDKPYKPMTDPGRVTQYVGIDICAGAEVDIVVEPETDWPFAEESADAVVCCQVLEHAKDPGFLVGQAARVLRKGGMLLVTVPFVFPEHGMPHDYRRLSRNGLKQLLEDHGFEVEEISGQGRVGSVIGTCLLTAIEAAMNRSRITRLLKGLLLPVWLILAFVVNVVSITLDAIFASSPIYCNSCAIARVPHD